MTTGRVQELWRYPVKSMQGERCEQLEFTARGVAADRLYAVRDANGKLGSGKDTRRFVRMEGLLDHRARGVEAQLEVELPNGERLRIDHPDLNARLSESLGQPVSLVREVELSRHLDAGPIHLLSSASLRWLAKTFGEASLDVRRFRPNLVVDLPGDESLELRSVGEQLRLGDTVLLKVESSTARCRMTALAQPGLSEDLRVTSVLRAVSGMQLGVYARVLVPGEVRVGDVVAAVAPDSRVH